jgi:hypothetical protein
VNFSARYISFLAFLRIRLQPLHVVLLQRQLRRCSVQAVHLLAHLNYFVTQLVDLLFELPGLCVVDLDVLALLHHVSSLACRHVCFLTLLCVLTLIPLFYRLKLVFKEDQVVSKSKIHFNVSVFELIRNLVCVIPKSLPAQSVVNLIKVASQFCDMLFSLVQLRLDQEVLHPNLIQQFLQIRFSNLL